VAVGSEAVNEVAGVWRRSVVKYGVWISQVKPSNYFRRLEKLVLLSIFDTIKSFILDDVKLAELSNNNERKTFKMGQNIL